MIKENACRECRLLIEEGEKCPNCEGTTFTTFWRGYIIIINTELSEISKRMGITKPGKYALRLSR